MQIFVKFNVGDCLIKFGRKILNTSYRALTKFRVTVTCAGEQYKRDENIAFLL